jgi:hypothetical protein
MGDEAPVHWVGQLVHDGYPRHGPQRVGDHRELPPGMYWTRTELTRVGDFRLAPAGREEADRVRCQQREDRTDELFGMNGLTLNGMALTDGQRRALVVPLGNLRSALEAQWYETLSAVRRRWLRRRASWSRSRMAHRCPRRSQPAAW